MLTNVTEASEMPEDPQNLKVDLQAAKRTIKRCSELNGRERVKKFKGDFVCLENDEEQVLQHIYTELQSSHPDVFDSDTENTDEADVFCSFEYCSIAEMSLVSTEVQGDSSILTYEAEVPVNPESTEGVASSCVEYRSTVELALDAESIENVSTVEDVQENSS